MMLVPKCGYPFSAHQRRRIKTEEKAKVVASVWGEEFIQFLAVLAVLPRTILNDRMNCTKKKSPGAIHPIIQIVLGKTASAPRN